jgi:hypothetical protein
MIVLSLCDRTGVMVDPWAQAGYECVCVDVQHEGRERRGNVTFLQADLMRRWLPPRDEYRIAFSFPACTNLAVSGARWFRDKGIRGLLDGLELVEACRDICEWTDAPWMLENPVSTISSYWREPDYTFHPSDFTAFELGDNYTKKTCLWTGNGFVMPSPNRAQDLPPPDDRIHKAAPGERRGDIRSITPRGFARAVFEANETASLVPLAAEEIAK